jgi:hypothetical protein
MSGIGAGAARRTSLISTSRLARGVDVRRRVQGSFFRRSLEAIHRADKI